MLLLSCVKQKIRKECCYKLLVGVFFCSQNFQEIPVDDDEDNQRIKIAVAQLLFSPRSKF
jgi:hypothetical protein